MLLLKMKSIGGMVCREMFIFYLTNQRAGSKEVSAEHGHKLIRLKEAPTNTSTKFEVNPVDVVWG